MSNAPDRTPTFGYCLNTSTLSAQRSLPLLEAARVAAKAGFTAIEPWVKEIERHRDEVGPLADLRRQIADLGLTVESAVGFAEWIVDDPARRAAGLERARVEMDLVAQIGGTRLAAPPWGAHLEALSSLDAAAERYRALLGLGERAGVVPQLELWGFSRTLTTLAQTAYVAIAAGHEQACLLLDVYHLFKGGSDLASLELLNGQRLRVFHMNDYPAGLSAQAATDADRVYPGDGVAPLDRILRTLERIGFGGFLSVELFNPSYWSRDPRSIAGDALAKTRAVVEGAIGAARSSRA